MSVKLTGWYAKNIPKKRIKRDEIERLIPEMLAGNDEAKHDLFNGCLYDIYQWAAGFALAECDVDDLFQTGAAKLWKALDYYDPEKGEFRSFMYYCVTSVMQGKSEQLRKTVSGYSESHKLHKMRKLIDEGYTVLEIAAQFAPTINEEEVMALMNPYEIDGKRERNAEEVFCKKMSIEDPTAAAAEHNELKKAIENALDTLSEREKEVLTMYYGLGGEEPLSYDQIGKFHHVTRERIRQIEQKALRKLRHPMRADELKAVLKED